MILFVAASQDTTWQMKSGRIDRDLNRNVQLSRSLSTLDGWFEEDSLRSSGVDDYLLAQKIALVIGL